MNKIPKRIICCWFGGKEKPEKVKKCIESWHKYMPDWEYIEINETNFDIDINKYCRDAYDAKKWAYVSDVARIWGLKEYGGIYMDTDVEVFKPLDKFLEHEFFTGFEQPYYPVTAVMGAIKDHWLINEMLDIYETKTFQVHDTWDQYETNVLILSDILGKYFDRTKEEFQEVDNMAIYPEDIFCHGGPNQYTRHWMYGSWT